MRRADRAPTAAPARPCQRDIPGRSSDRDQKTGKQEEIVKTLDADRDGRPEILIVIDPKSGQTASRAEDTDYDGTLDAKNAYLPDGRLASREEDTNQDGKPDRWLVYDGSDTATRVEVDHLRRQPRRLLSVPGMAWWSGRRDRTPTARQTPRQYVAGRRDVEIEMRTSMVSWTRTPTSASGVPTRVERDKNQDGKTGRLQVLRGSNQPGS
jgi:hypothetical protein